MNKCLQGLSVLALGFLALGTHIAKTDVIFWFASTQAVYQYVRILLIGILLIQLVTHPPRHMVIRLLTGGVAVGVGLWTVQQTWSYQMPALDSLAFLSASIGLGIVALEHRINLSYLDAMSRVKNRSGSQSSTQ